jgi:hypothetical protein
LEIWKVEKRQGAICANGRLELVPSKSPNEFLHPKKFGGSCKILLTKLLENSWNPGLQILRPFYDGHAETLFNQSQAATIRAMQHFQDARVRKDLAETGDTHLAETLQ